jgi:hypothetical protein
VLATLQQCGCLGTAVVQCCMKLSSDAALIALITMSDLRVVVDMIAACAQPEESEVRCRGVKQRYPPGAEGAEGAAAAGDDPTPGRRLCCGAARRRRSHRHDLADRFGSAQLPQRRGRAAQAVHERRRRRNGPCGACNTLLNRRSMSSHQCTLCSYSSR